MLVWILFANSYAAAQSSQSDLTSEVKYNMRMGLEAAKLEEWELAIDYFVEAQKLEPKNSQVLYNLAVASDASKRDFIAIIAYKTYLAATPHTPNIREIRERIQRLEARIEAHIPKLIDALKKSVRNESSEIQDQAMPLILATHTMLDVSEAKRIPSWWPRGEKKWRAYGIIALLQVEHHWDIDGAKATIKLIQDQAIKSDFQKELDAEISRMGQHFTCDPEWPKNALDLWLTILKKYINYPPFTLEEFFSKVSTSVIIEIIIETSSDKTEIQRKIEDLFLGARGLLVNLRDLRAFDNLTSKSHYLISPLCDYID